MDTDGIALRYADMENKPEGHIPKKGNLAELKNRLLMFKAAIRHNELSLFKESESYFRNLVNSAPVALIMTDTCGRCLFANEYWRTISGLNLQRSIGDGWQTAVHPEDVGKIGAWFYPGEKKQADPGTECRIYAAGGESKWVDFRAAPLYDDKGAIIGFIASFSDITHLKDNGFSREDKIPSLENAGSM